MSHRTDARGSGPRRTESRAEAEPSTGRGRPEAGVRDRSLAYLADFVLVGGALAAVAARRDRSARDRPWLSAAVATAVATLYHVALEGLFGRTAGKALRGVEVRSEAGGPCTVRAAAVRTALRPVDWLPAGYLVGILAILVTGRRQRLGDLLADTVVVRTPSGDD